MKIKYVKIQFATLFSQPERRNVKKAFRQITNHLQGESYFRQLCLSCSQNNFGLLERFLVSFQPFNSRTKRRFRPARMAEKLSRFVSLDKPIDKFIEEQKNTLLELALFINFMF